MTTLAATRQRSKLLVSPGTSALTTLFWQRYPNSPWRWVVLSAGAAVTAATGWGPVEAGKHFVSDVLGGWLLGGTLGYVMPTLVQHGLRVEVQRRVDIKGGSERRSACWAGSETSSHPARAVR